jgi:hypothetical protein
VALASQAGRGHGARRAGEDALEGLEGARELAAHRRLVELREVILPAPVVPGVHADLVALVRDAPHQVGEGRGHGSRRQQRAGEDRPPAVQARGAGGEHLLQEAALPHDVEHRLAGVVRTEGQEEGGAPARCAQRVQQGRHAVAHPVVRVDVDLEDGGGHARAHESCTSPSSPV